MDFKCKIINFILGLAAVLLLAGFVTFLFDPFFHYHKPWLGMKAVLTDKEYQCIGTIRNFDYDALIVGSSVCENYNNAWFDDAFGCKSVKAIRSYGATADLCYFLDEAYLNHDIRYVFYNIDPGCLAQTPELTLESAGCPMYLYDNNPINDIQYLLNKDVIFKKIPYMVAKSFIGEYDEGESYNWGQWKEFNEDMITGLYIRKHSIEKMRAADTYIDECNANVDMIEGYIEAHPETQFIIFIPPYSMVWWDNIYRNGDTDSYLYNMKIAMERLTEHSNVRLFYFLNDEEVTTELNNYMDVLHFSPEINAYMVEQMQINDRAVKQQDIDNIIEHSRDLADRTVKELIVPYEDRIKVAYYDE